MSSYPARGETIVVRGLEQFLRAADLAGKEVRREVRETLRITGDEVRLDSLRLFAGYGKAAKGSANFGGSRASHAAAALGFRTYVRYRGVSVEQSQRKTTGKHPEYGGAQMRHGLLPGLEKNKDSLESNTEKAMDRIADYFDSI